MRFANGTRRVSALFTVLLLVLASMPVMPASASTMIPQTPIPTGLSPKGVAIGDVNGDGRNDVAVANFRGNGLTGTVSIYLQRSGGAGLGTAPDQTITLPYLGNAASVKIADFTGDGKNDVLVGDAWYQRIHIYEYQLGGYLRVYSIPLNEKGGTTPGGPVSSPFSFDVGRDLEGSQQLLIPRFYVTSIKGDSSQFDGDNGGLRLEVEGTAYPPDYTSIAAVPGSTRPGYISSYAIALGGPDAVFNISQDDGQHWRFRASKKAGVRSMAFWDAEHGWAVGGGDFLKSSNGGHDWQVFNVDGRPDLTALDMVSADSGMAVGKGGAIYTLAGGDWTKVTNQTVIVDFEALSFRQTTFGFAVGRTQEGTAVAARCYAASDAMVVSSEPMPEYVDYHGVSQNPEQTVAIAVGDNGAIARRTNLFSWDAWTDVVSPTAVDLNGVRMLGGGIGYAVGDNGTVLKTTDDGQSWSAVVSGGEDLVTLSFLDEERGWVAGANGTLLYTVDGGMTWDDQSYNQYGGSSGSTLTYPVPVNPYSAVIADFDDDGKPDIGGLSYSSGSFAPMYSAGGAYPDGLGSVSVPVIRPLFGDKALAAAAGDLNGDGKTDLAAISYMSGDFSPKGEIAVALQNSISWLTNNPTQELATGIGPQDLVLGDVSGDGRLDAVVPNSYNNGASYRTTGTVGVFVQNTEGQLDPMLEFDVGRQPYHAAVGDVDSDGKNEIIVTNQVSNTIQVLKYGSPLPPKISSKTWAADGTYSRLVAGSVSLETPPDFDGIAGYYYTIDHSAGTVPSAKSRFTTDNTLDINFNEWLGSATTAEGDWYVHVISKDKAGHVGDRASHYRVRLDLKAPSEPMVAAGGASWTNTAKRDLTWPASTDSLSGVAYYAVNVDGARVATTTETKYSIDKLKDGSRAIRIDVLDKAGNLRKGTTTYANIDVGLPTVSISAPAAGALIARTFTFKANASDAAGIRSVKFYLDGRTTPFYTDGIAPYAVQYDTKALANGSHTLKVVATDMYGHAVSASRSFKTDNTAPSITNVSGSPSPVFYPILKDGYKDTFTTRFTINEGGTAYLQVYTASGAMYREIKASKSAGTNSLVWDGVSKSGTKSTGTFYWRLVMKDAAGNIATTSKRAITIRNYEIVQVAPNQVRTVPR